MSPFSKPITLETPYKLCFVCLGNICRSPTAEGLFIQKVKKADLELYFYIDSAGTAAYHIGEPANSKSQSTANSHGIYLPSKARRFEYSDLEEFDLILAMDSSNRINISQLDTKGRFTEKIRLMREYDPNPDSSDVPDPYYGGQQAFEKVFQILDRSCNALLSKLKTQIKE